MLSAFFSPGIYKSQATGGMIDYPGHTFLLLQIFPRGGFDTSQSGSASAVSVPPAALRHAMEPFGLAMQSFFVNPAVASLQNTKYN